MLEFLNKSETFLQWMSIYNIASPVISFFIPIIILIIPFFIIKLKGLSLTISEYIEVLKTVISNHAIGKLFTEFNNVEMSEKLYLLASAGFYVFSIYQNVIVCTRFNNNMYKIHKYFSEIKEYLVKTINSMENYLSYSSSLHTHLHFNNTLIEILNYLPNVSIKRDTAETIISQIEFEFELEEEFPFTRNLFDDLLLLLKEINIIIDGIEHQQYKERYIFIRNSEKAVIDFEYKNNGFFGRVVPIQKQSNSSQLISDIKTALQTFKQEDYAS